MYKAKTLKTKKEAKQEGDAFVVTVLGRKFNVNATSYSKARTKAAHLYNEEMRSEHRDELPLAFLTARSQCERVDAKSTGRPRVFDPLFDRLLR